MHLKTGFVIKSTPALTGTYFSDVIILLTECNAQGAAGFVLNRPFGRSLHELEEFKASRPIALYEGGPVDQEHLFFLHRRPDIIAEGVPVGNGIYFGGNFQKGVAAINDNRMSASDIKILVGYCGWDAGELEAEIAEGSWKIIDLKPEAVFA